MSHGAQTVAGPKLSGIVWVWDNTQSSTTKSKALNEAEVACSYKRVTICAELFTITVWMYVPNSHLPVGSLRGWLPATGEGRRKSAAKSSLASNHHGVWM